MTHRTTQAEVLAAVNKVQDIVHKMDTRLALVCHEVAARQDHAERITKLETFRAQGKAVAVVAAALMTVITFASGALTKIIAIMTGGIK